MPHIAYAGKRAEHFVSEDDHEYFESHKCPRCGVVVAIYLTRNAKPRVDEWNRGTEQLAAICPSHDYVVIYQVVKCTTDTRALLRKQ